MSDQLSILADNLDKKIAVLEDIKEYNIRQQEALSQDSIDVNEFDDALDEKDELIQRLEELDDGFEAIYQGVEQQIHDNKDAYAEQIKLIQGKIAQINEMSAAIGELETKNKELITGHFDKIKTNIKQGRQGSKAAYDYYRNMSGAAYSSAQFMDNKY